MHMNIIKGICEKIDVSGMDVSRVKIAINSLDHNFVRRILKSA